MKALSFANALAHTDVRDALRETIRERVGIDVEMLYVRDAYDKMTDQIIAHLHVSKYGACMKIVHDLMLVYYINQWLVSFYTEPEWSPYP